MSLAKRIKNNWVLAFIGTPIFVGIAAYCLVSDDFDGSSGKVIGGIMAAIIVGAWYFGIIRK